MIPPPPKKKQNKIENKLYINFRSNHKHAESLFYKTPCTQTKMSIKLTCNIPFLKWKK